jgi:uncharacterized C2H2 Zn-finger protein
MIHGGWDYAKRLYRTSRYYERKTTTTQLRILAGAFEEANIHPPLSAERIDSMHNWMGSPIQFQTEDGKAVLRSAGHDGVFNSADDITREVNIAHETKYQLPRDRPSGPR